MPPPSHYIQANGYDAWCYERGYGLIQEWLSEQELEARPADDPDWPGEIHLAQLFVGEPLREETYNENFWPGLSPGHASTLRLALAERLQKESIGDQFEDGKVVGGRWKITEQLTAAKGYFNLGIFRVSEIGVERGRKGILKLLPTKGMQPGMSAREIKLHSSLKHPAIVELYDSHLPFSPHEVPWIITEYCSLQTLEQEVEMHMAHGTHATEEYIWEVFIQLLSAVQYSHHGPGDTLWDPISHRDIILSNIFQQVPETTSTSPFNYIVKLGDFGCAISQSEMDDMEPDIYSLPAIDGSYCPPEGPVATERGDVYEVGLVIFCIFCEADNPNDIPLHEFIRRKWQPWWCEYSEELKSCIIECLNRSYETRTTAGEMLSKVSRLHSELLASGKLKV